LGKVEVLSKPGRFIAGKLGSDNHLLVPETAVMGADVADISEMLQEAEVVFGRGFVWDDEPASFKAFDLIWDGEGGFGVVHGFPLSYRKKATRHFEDIWEDIALADFVD
jgi:hypothetical protein